MTLNIKREETCQLAAELAGLTGENRTEAITRALRERLEREGSIFQTTSDTEVILHLMARNPRSTVIESALMLVITPNTGRAPLPRSPSPPRRPCPWAKAAVAINAAIPTITSVKISFRFITVS